MGKNGAMRKSRTAAGIVVWCVCAGAPLQAQTITKCQDAQGQWHYGNYASDKCAGDQPISELKETGVTVQVREAPPTLEELQAKQAAERAEREAKIKREEKLRIDRELLEKYESEEIIIQLRDNRLAELHKQIEFNRRQLERLEDDLGKAPEPKSEVEQQAFHEDQQLVQRFRRAIEVGLATVEKTSADYQALLDRYRQIE